MILQPLGEDSTASKEAMEFPHFLFEVGEGKVSADASNFIRV